MLGALDGGDLARLDRSVAVGVGAPVVEDVEGGPRVSVDDAGDRQLFVGLECPHGVQRLVSEEAVDGSDLVLQDLSTDCTAAIAGPASQRSKGNSSFSTYSHSGPVVVGPTDAGGPEESGAEPAGALLTGAELSTAAAELSVARAAEVSVAATVVVVAAGPEESAAISSLGASLGATSAVVVSAAARSVASAAVVSVASAAAVDSAASASAAAGSVVSAAASSVVDGVAAVVVGAAAVAGVAAVVVGASATVVSSVSPPIVSLASSSSSPQAANPPTATSNAAPRTIDRALRRCAPPLAGSCPAAVASDWWFDIDDSLSPHGAPAPQRTTVLPGHLTGTAPGPGPSG